MFSYLLSVAIAFIVFGTIFNILRNIKPNWFGDSNIVLIYWCTIAIASSIWFAVAAILVVVLITYLLKLLVDKISKLILKGLKK